MLFFEILFLFEIVLNLFEIEREIVLALASRTRRKEAVEIDRELVSMY